MTAPRLPSGILAVMVACSGWPRSTVTLALAALLAVACPRSAAGGEVPVVADDPAAAPPRVRGYDFGGYDFGPDVRLWWDEGLNYQIGRFQVFEALDARERLQRTGVRGRVNARLDVDGAGFVGGQGLGEFDDGPEVRRFQISTSGEAFLIFPVEYFFRFSLSGDRLFLDDNYLGVRPGFGIDRLRVGQFKPPQSLENLTSSYNTVFMERAAPVQALAPSAKSGLEASGRLLDERVLWSLGVFSLGSSSDTGEQSRAPARVVGRVSWTPVGGTPERPRVLHLGLSGSFAFAGDQDIRYQSRPESFLAPIVVDTRPISSEYAQVVGLEAAYVDGPWTVQSEYLHAVVEPVGGGTLSFPGFYVLASRFLTGESRPYSAARGTFTSVRPRRPVFPSWGPGAWEVALRVSYVDLDSGEVSGGRLTSTTVGVNWYLSSFLELRFNYVFASVAGRAPGGQVNIFQTRLGMAF